MRTSRRSTFVAVMAVLSMLGAGCGNSKNPAGSSRNSSSEKVASSAPGVTNSEIRVGGVASVTNPLGGKYDDAFVGAKAYFDEVNAKGGIYGRQLVLAAQHDDKVASNGDEVAKLINQDNVFAALPVATLLFTGAQKLVDAKIPTFGWTINPEWEGTAEQPKSNLFGQSGSFLCFNCATPALPWLAQKIGAHKIGVLAYSVPQSSDCADGVKASFEKYGPAVDAKVDFVDQSLSYGVSDLGVQVSRMKSAGVDLVTTCMDNNGVVTLAKEIKKQQLKAVQSLPNAYDHDFLKEFGDLFEGSYVRTDFVPFEVTDPPPGLTRYLAAMKKADAEPSENSLVGWLNADLFVAGLKAAGKAFTRESVIDAINKMTNYRADGILTGVDWTRQHTQLKNPNEACQVFSKIHDSKFVPVFSKPGKPFVCAEAHEATAGQDASITTEYKS